MASSKARAKRREARQLDGDVTRIAAKMLEAITVDIDFVDPRGAYADDAGGADWLAIGSGSTKEHVGLPTTEEELARCRQVCRLLATENDFGKNAIENRISYTVGSGHVYSVEWKKDEEEDKESTLLEDVEAVIADFCKQTRWAARQMEIRRRLDRDGECFLRLFERQDQLLVRFVEPWQVSTPTHMASSKADAFGIRTDPDDVETVLGYWVDGDLIDADKIQHRKANVDMNVRRGLPSLWTARKELHKAKVLLDQLATKVGIHTAIALIRTHKAASATGISSFVQANANKTVTNSATGETSYHRKYGAGTIIDAPEGVSYDLPAASLKVKEAVDAVQAQLRAAASSLVMPEFMLSSDASNANYSSTMVAENPSVKMFQRLQYETIEFDTALIERALRLAESTGRLPAGTVDRINVVATPTNLQTSNRLDDAQADQILVDKGAMSRQTMAERNDLDWDTEKQRMAETGTTQPDGTTEPTAEPVPADGSDPANAAASTQTIQTAQDLVLNGAQLQAAVAIVNSVATGEIPRDSGLGILTVLFNLNPQQAASVMGSAGTSTPTTPNPNPAKQAEIDAAANAPSPADNLAKQAQEAWKGYP